QRKAVVRERSARGQPLRRILVDAGLALERQREQPEQWRQERRGGGRQPGDEADARPGSRDHRAAAPSARGSSGAASRVISRPATPASVRLTASITTATAAARPASRSKNPRRYMK